MRYTIAQVDSIASSAGATRDEVLSIMAEDGHEVAQASAAPAEATATPTGISNPNLNRQWSRAVPRAALRTLPDVMTALGGISGIPAGPGGMLLMGGLGRAGGEAMRQLGEHAMGEGPRSPLEAMSRINRQAGAGAMMEAGGVVMRPLMGMASRRFAREGLRAPLGLQREAQDLGESFDVNRMADIMLREKAASSGRAATLRKESSAGVEEAIGVFDRRLKRFNAKDLAGALIQQKQRRLKRRLTPDERKATIKMVRERSNELLDELTPGTPRVPQTPGGNPARALFSGSDVKALAQAARESSKRTIAADQSGSIIPAQRSLDRAIYRGALRTKARIPGVAEGDRRTRDLINLERALIQREGTVSPTVPQLAMTGAPVIGGLATGNLPGFLPAAAAAYAVSSPSVLRRLALVSANPAVQSASTQWPTVPSALWQILTEGQRPPTGGR